MNLKPISTRALTVSYAAALLIIAVLSLTSHTVLDYHLKNSAGSSAIINQCGRQRMLSQRIAALAAQYRLGDETARPALVDAIDSFDGSHRELIKLTTTAPSSEARRLLRAIYFQGPNPLDGQVSRFVAEAKRVAAAGPDDPAAAAALKAIFAQSRGPLLAGLEEVVAVQEQAAEQRIARLQRLQWGILAVVLVALAGEAILIFRPMIRRIAAYTAALLQLATTDALTGAANRRSFMERCAAELDRARRDNHPTSLVMLDVDHFKSINDTYGHAAGDEVLRAIGAALSGTLRQNDIYGRLGGEEFGALLVETSLPTAAVVAERICARIAAAEVAWGEHRIKFTASAGVTSLAAGDGGLEESMHVADRLMYQAKRTGRNRTVVQAAV